MDEVFSNKIENADISKLTDDKSADAQQSGSHVSKSKKQGRPLSWVRNKTPIKPQYLENIRISKQDFELALGRVQPSSKREGFATVPDVTWDDVGSLKNIRKELKERILVIFYDTFLA